MPHAVDGGVVDQPTGQDEQVVEGDPLYRLGAGGRDRNIRRAGCSTEPSDRGCREER